LILGKVAFLIIFEELRTVDSCSPCSDHIINFPG
jgi:hypothetical protein